MSGTSEYIEVVGALDGGAHYDASQVAAILDSERVALGSGKRFTGRPGTGIYVGDGAVVKVREDLDLNVKVPARWIEEAMDSERALGIYHPHKTWFVLRDKDETRAGSICPQLEPLHMAIEASDDADWRLGQLTTLVEMYARTVRDHDVRLDEGLSNFGLDGDGRLFYLDDEVYRWDRFSAFTQWLGVCVRVQEWLTAELLERLGRMIADAWMNNFPDPNASSVIGRRARDLAVVNDSQRKKVEALIAGLEVYSSKKHLLERNARKRKADGKAEDKSKGKSKAKGNGKDTAAGNGKDTAAGNGRPLPEGIPCKGAGQGEPLALLADIHGNAPALEAVLAKLREMGVTEGLVLGDVVGYGPHPAECIQMLRDAGFSVIKGNHDQSVATGYFVKGMNSTAQWAAEWSRSVLDEEDLEWLEALPNCLRDGDWYAVHGSPMDPQYFYAYVYHMTAEENLDYLQENDLRLAFHGHTHMPGVHYRQPDGEDGYSTEDMDLNGNICSLICPGSVGKTRTGSPSADFAILDTSAGHLRLMGVDYDMKPLIADMERLDFPGLLVSRIRQGK